jgi:MFS family permease
VLNALTVSSIAAVFGILGFAALSDRVGRRPVVLVGALAMTVWAFVLFPLVESGSTALLVLAVVVGQGVVHAAMYGPLAALYTELFSTRSRYTGASLGYQIAGIGAGLGPVVFATVLQTSGNVLWVSVVIAAFCVLTVVCVALAGETSRQSLDAHDAPADAAAAGTTVP